MVLKVSRECPASGGSTAAFYPEHCSSSQPRKLGPEGQGCTESAPQLGRNPLPIRAPGKPSGLGGACRGKVSWAEHPMHEDSKEEWAWGC